jgi:DNA-binding NarL/FixJ family response regulator
VIRVLLVDDHQLVRAGVTTLLQSDPQITVVGEARNGREAVESVEGTAPDVVLMDLSMPEMDGVEATRAVLAVRPDTRVLVLTSFSDRQRVKEVLAAGAIGYVLKDSEPADLIAAVHAAALGHVPIDPRVAAALLPSAAGSGGSGAAGVAGGAADGLSPRETEVLRLVAQGLANKQIARALGITERTVKAHLGRVFREIGVLDRTSAALWARDNLPGA